MICTCRKLKDQERQGQLIRERIEERKRRKQQQQAETTLCRDRTMLVAEAELTGTAVGDNVVS